MDNQTLAKAVLKDILARPNARDIAVIVNNALKSGRYTKQDDIQLANWILTGENPPDLIKLFDQSFVDAYVSGKKKNYLINGIIAQLMYKIDANERKAVSGQLLSTFAKRSDIAQIIKQLKMTDALANLAIRNEMIFDEAVHMLSNWLLTGETKEITERYWDIEFLTDPVSVPEEILLDISKYNKDVVRYLSRILESVGTEGEYDRLKQLPESEKLSYLLEILSKYENKEDLQNIHNFFYQVPTAPPVPIVDIWRTGLIGGAGGPVYESCVQDVKAKQSPGCAEMNYPAYGHDSEGHKCYNPWAVCTKSVGRNR